MEAEYVDHMGTDLSVVNAARVSFANRSDWAGNGDLLDKDKNLIGYLARGCTKTEWRAYLEQIMFAGKDTLLGEGSSVREQSEEQLEDTVQHLIYMATHWVPFTHTAITLRMKAPVPIRTQCFKSKVGFTESEESRRYISSTPELFVPDSFREHSSNVKQGSGSVHARSIWWMEVYKLSCTKQIETYLAMLADGICEEQARFILPQGVQVNWIWTGNLAAYARYFNLRYDNHAQKESQVLAEQVANIIEPLFPVSWKALTRVRRTGA